MSALDEKSRALYSLRGWRRLPSFRRIHRGTWRSFLL